MGRIRGCWWKALPLLAALGLLGAAGCASPPVGTLAPVGSDGTETSLQTRFANFTVTDPKAAFSKLNYPHNKKGGRRLKESIKTPGQAYLGNAEHHIQGYAVYDRGDKGVFQIFSANAQKTGFIYIAKGTYGGTKVTKFDVPTGFNHPAGMQIIGDYLLVGMEGNCKNMTESEAKAIPACDKAYSAWPNIGAVYMYNLTKLYENPKECCGGGTKPPADPVLLRSISGKSAASSVGIASITGNSQYSANDGNWDAKSPHGIRYIMGVHDYDDHDVWLFISKPGISLAQADGNTFASLKVIDLPKDHSYDGMALMSQPDNSIWMAGFHSTGNYTDYADLFNLTSVSPGKVVTIQDPFKKPTQREHFETETETSIAGYSVHFRWGTSLNIYADDKLRLNASEREFGTAGQEAVTVNWFFNH